MNPKARMIPPNRVADAETRKVIETVQSAVTALVKAVQSTPKGDGAITTQEIYEPKIGASGTVQFVKRVLTFKGGVLTGVSSAIPTGLTVAPSNVTLVQSSGGGSGGSTTITYVNTILPIPFAGLEP